MPALLGSTVKFAIEDGGMPMAVAKEVMLASIGSVIVTTASQLFVPPQTPQLSIGKLQHSPDGASACEQHIPVTSTITPLPPHTPQASTKVLQHRPSASVEAPPEQHAPVNTSIAAASQQNPLMSMTAVGEQLPPIGWRRITLQLAPPHPLLQTQVPWLPQM